jgi:hypothetical protein
VFPLEAETGGRMVCRMKKNIPFSHAYTRLAKKKKKKKKKEMKNLEFL